MQALARYRLQPWRATRPSIPTLTSLGGEARPLEEWLTTFHLASVVLDPYTNESSWVLKTAARILENLRGTDARVNFVVTADADGADAFLGPLTDEFLVFCDPDRAFVRTPRPRPTAGVRVHPPRRHAAGQRRGLGRDRVARGRRADRRDDGVDQPDDPRRRRPWAVPRHARTRLKRGAAAGGSRPPGRRRAAGARGRARAARVGAARRATRRRQDDRRPAVAARPAVARAVAS